MGYKRPFDNEEFQELTYKQQKQLDYSTKLTSFAEEVPHYDAPQKHDVSGQDDGGFGKCSEDPEVLLVADKDVESSTPLSWVTSCSSDEDAVCGKEAYSSLFPECFEFNFPKRTHIQPKDIYLSFLDRFPRKRVPVGPNYQANIPAWGLHKKNKKSDRVEVSNPLEASPQLMGSDHIFDTEEEERLLGVCVVPMLESDLSAQGRDKAGDGRKNCNCLDEGSVRCVRLHIVEAREELRKIFGLEKFMDLGFCDMGEEVAHKWSEEEEQIFHEVVFSNPASLGTNFWKHLALELPSRTTRELVSYYFNVFMLRRRAAQNRYNFLDIDSDNDEWHGRNGDSLNFAATEDENFSVESLADEDDQLDDEEDSSDDDDDGDSDDDGDGLENTTKVDGGRIHMMESNPADKILRSFREDLDAQDDSCMSFECQSNMTDSCGPLGAGAVMQEDGVRNNHSDCWRGDSNGSNNDAGSGYVFDDSDARYSAGLDLLPTFNMIEEFFGPGSSKNSTNDDKDVN